MTRRELLTRSAAIAAGSLAAHGGRGAAASSGFVRASGRQLVDPAGQKLLLRGINLGNWFEPEGYMFLFDKGPQSPREIEDFANELIGPVAAENFWRAYRQRYITADDIRLIARAGLNSVRIPLHYKFFLTEGEGFTLLDQALGWCREAKLWVILDLHCAPGGQTGTNIDDSWGYPWLYESQADQQLTCDIWQRIAKRYKDETVVLGYDLLNEPIPHYPRLQKYNAALEPLYRRIVAAIRAVDPHHIVILGGAQWDSNFHVFGPPFDPNTLYQFHKYWMKPDVGAIQQYLDFRELYNVPIWLGESGENTDDWVKQFVAVLEAHEIGWCFWPYKKMEKSSCLVSVPKPAAWDEVVAFAQLPAGTGNAEKRIAARPSLEIARRALDDLLHNIELDACRRNPGYFAALGLKLER